MPLFKLLRAAITGTLMIASTGAAAGWSVAAQDISRSVGATHQIRCPAGGTGGTVWGSGIYTADSSVCMAAVHAGFINQATGGTVQFRILGGQQSYAGSTNNGVTTLSYPSWGLSFQVLGAASPATANRIGWNHSLQSLNLQGNTGATYTFTCNAGTPSGAVWGSDIYTSDSSICTAAVHSGLISGAGGTIRLRVIEGQPNYYGSSRNGVATRSYGNWSSSFIFQ